MQSPRLPVLGGWTGGFGGWSEELVNLKQHKTILYFDFALYSEVSTAHTDDHV